MKEEQLTKNKHHITPYYGLNRVKPLVFDRKCNTTPHYYKYNTAQLRPRYLLLYDVFLKNNVLLFIIQGRASQLVGYGFLVVRLPRWNFQGRHSFIHSFVKYIEMNQLRGVPNIVGLLPHLIKIVSGTPSLISVSKPGHYATPSDPKS